MRLWLLALVVALFATHPANPNAQSAAANTAKELWKEREVLKKVASSASKLKAVPKPTTRPVSPGALGSAAADQSEESAVRKFGKLAKEKAEDLAQDKAQEKIQQVFANESQPEDAKAQPSAAQLELMRSLREKLEKSEQHDSLLPAAAVVLAVGFWAWFRWFRRA